MATTNIIGSRKVTGAYDSDTRLFPNQQLTSDLHSYWDIELADLVGIGAFTSGDIKLESLPAGAIMTYARLQLLEVLDSTGDLISAATARLTFNGTDMGTGTLNLLGTVNSVINDITGLAGSVAAVNDVKVHFALTGANANTILAGKVRVWYECIVLGPVVIA